MCTVIFLFIVFISNSFIAMAQLKKIEKWHVNILGDKICRSELYYVDANGNIQGTAKKWSAANVLIAEVNYKDNLEHGVSQLYDDAGILFQYAIYEQGKIKELKAWGIPFYYDKKNDKHEMPRQIVTHEKYDKDENLIFQMKWSAISKKLEPTFGILPNGDKFEYESTNFEYAGSYRLTPKNSDTTYHYKLPGGKQLVGKTTKNFQIEYKYMTEEDAPEVALFTTPYGKVKEIKTETQGGTVIETIWRTRASWGYAKNSPEEWCTVRSINESKGDVMHYTFDDGRETYWGGSNCWSTTATGDTIRPGGQRRYELIAKSKYYKNLIFDDARSAKEFIVISSNISNISTSLRMKDKRLLLEFVRDTMGLTDELLEEMNLNQRSPITFIDNGSKIFCTMLHPLSNDAIRGLDSLRMFMREFMEINPQQRPWLDSLRRLDDAYTFFRNCRDLQAVVDKIAFLIVDKNTETGSMYFYQHFTDATVIHEIEFDSNGIQNPKLRWFLNNIMQPWVEPKKTKAPVQKKSLKERAGNWLNKQVDQMEQRRNRY